MCHRTEEHQLILILDEVVDVTADDVVYEGSKILNLTIVQI